MLKQQRDVSHHLISIFPFAITFRIIVKPGSYFASDPSPSQAPASGLVPLTDLLLS